MDDQFIIVARSVLVPSSLTINVIWKNSFAGFVKLQIRLLSIMQDCENGFYIVSAKSKKVYRGPHQGGVPMYLISNNKIVEEYQYVEQEPISNRIEGYWVNDVNYTISITPLYFNNMSYNILQEIDDTTIISVNTEEVYIFNETSELYEDCGQFVKQDRY